MHRIYDNGEITVFWDSEKCRHAKRCVTGSPSVFNIQKRPWIDITGAQAAEIWQTVSSCPTRALTVIYDHGIRVELNEERRRSAAFDGDREIGECEYRITPEGWEIYHTGVRSEYTGQGIAKRLLYTVVEAAEKSGAEVIPVCSYAAAELKSGPRG